jgi:ABC-2 type transport system permease protein
MSARPIGDPVLAGKRYLDKPPPRRDSRERTPLWSEVRLIAATARAHVLRAASSPIMIVRSPLTPVLLLISMRVVYSASGQGRVNGQDVVGYLAVGMLATLAWTAAVWGGGSALQSEIYAGTFGAVIVAPGRTASVIIGNGIGGIIWGIPGLAACLAIAVPLGAHVDIHHPVATICALLALYLSALAIGVGFGGLFILSRQANAMSNFFQAPIYLLAGFYVPRSILPGWLHAISDVIPMSHAIDALRDTTLSGASFVEVWRPLLATVGTAGLFMAVGVWSLRRMDDSLRRRGSLDLL